MVCVSCRTGLPAGSRFCTACGGAQPVACPSCAGGNPPLARFCARCDAELAIGPVAPALSAAAAAERRQLTMMFCDLVGSTALSVRLDPEDLCEVIIAYQRYVTETVTQFGGFVARYLGDGVLVYFGYPQAHEHDAECAVRAGLALISGLGGRRWPCGVAPQIRVGLATGLVVVGDFAGESPARDYDVVGETPNLAARLQAAAEPNTVVIAPGTRRLTGGLFTYRDLGALALKGFAGTVHAWQVTGLSAAMSRFEALHETGTAPLLGRDRELELLLRRWEHAKRGEGRVVLLSGEAGIGKSRLTAALMQQVAEEPHFRLRYFCSPHHTDSALHPVIAQLERAAEFEPEDSPVAKLDKLEALLTRQSALAEDASLIAELLALAEVDRRYPRLDLASPQRKERTLQALWRQIEALSRHRPMLAIFEDAQWIDPTTLELLSRVIRQVSRLPVLLVVTFRPDFDAPWAPEPGVKLLTLNRLDRPAGAELVNRFSGGEALTGEIVEEILERADGVPLFIEELTKAVVEAGTTEAGELVASIPAGPHHIPATLHASLTSRLDRLGPAKELAQIGAVVGRQFSYRLLAAIAGRDEAELRPLLERITASGLVFQDGTPPQANFLFKHALVQDVAYGSLLRSARQRLHTRVAATLEAEFPATPPEILAQHWARAGDAERAVSRWHNAGRRAIQRRANREAIAQLTKGLRMLERLPESRERDRTELGLQLLLAEALTADRGWTAPETRPGYARARELCARIGDAEALFPVLYGQFSYNLSRGEAAAHVLADETLQLIEGSEEPALLAMAHSMRAMSLFARGEFATAREHLELVLALHHPDSRSYTFLSPGHNFAIASMWHALALVHLGYPEQASREIAAGFRAARALFNPHTLSHALALSCRCYAVLGEVEPLRRATEELAGLAAEHQFPFYAAVATIYRGWLLAETEERTRGIEILREGMAAFLDLGAAALIPYFWARVADLSVAVGPAREALERLDDALAQLDRSGQRWCEAELQRSRGELLRRLSDERNAEACFQQALMVAQRQQAKLLELRAACSLARLWRDQGRRDEARDLLEPIYLWFTEGFDTPRLKEANALLDALLAPAGRGADLLPAEWARLPVH